MSELLTVASAIGASRRRGLERSSSIVSQSVSQYTSLQLKVRFTSGSDAMRCVVVPSGAAHVVLRVVNVYDTVMKNQAAVIL